MDAAPTDYSKVYAESIEGYKQDNFLKILKANALLMIYNLVESTVSNGIEEIYDKLNANNATYSTVRKEIQDIWFSFKFGQVYQPEAHFRSYKNKALEIINSIVIGETIELSGKALRFEGNLDADEIRKVCDVHGIEFRPDDTCKELLRNKMCKIAAGFLLLGGAGNPQECFVHSKGLPCHIAAKRLGKMHRLFLNSS